MSEQRTILLLVASLEERGGTQRAVADLGTLLSSTHRVIECAFDGSSETRAFETANQFESLGVRRAQTRLMRFVGYFVAARRLRSLQRRCRVDVTISNLWAADFVSVLAGRIGKRLSITHTNIVDNPDNRLMVRFRFLGGWMYRRFDAVVAVNEQLRQEVTGLFALRHDRTAMIPNFVPVRQGGATRTPAEGRLRRRIVWCGRLSPAKNLGPFLDVFAAVLSRDPRVQLLVVGDGPERLALITHALEIGLRVSEDSTDAVADVIFAGFCSSPEEQLRTGELFVMTSLSEGFGLVLVEAMLAGLPVVAGNCPGGGPLSILHAGPVSSLAHAATIQTNCGYLLPVPRRGDGDALQLWADIIVDLLNDEPQRARMAAAGRVRAREFSPERAGLRWARLLARLA